jgi:hypothetical protein
LTRFHSRDRPDQNRDLPHFSISRFISAQAASVACLHLARSVVLDALRQVVQILGQIVEEFDYVAGVLRVGGGFDCAGMGGRPAEDANLVGPVLNERRQETLRREIVDLVYRLLPLAPRSRSAACSELRAITTAARRVPGVRKGEAPRGQD